MDFQSPIFVSMAQSVVRASLLAAAGGAAIKVQEGEMNTAVGVVTAVLLSLISLGWSAFNHKKNINMTPPPPAPPSGGGGIPSAFLLAFLLSVGVAGTSVTMVGCKAAPVITAAQLAEFNTQADAGEAELQAQIDTATAAGNVQAAASAQKVLDKFRSERAKYASYLKTDETGNVDVVSSIGSAAMLAAPPGIGAGILILMAIAKRLQANQKPPTIPGVPT